MGRKLRLSYKYLVPRKKGIIIRTGFFILTVFSLICGWSLSEPISKYLYPKMVLQNLNHFRVNRNLKRYLDEIEVLIEPSSVECEGVPLLVLVSSSPEHFAQRQAIRTTWGPYFPTYFVMGHHEYTIQDLKSEIFIEAKHHSDIIMYNYTDHYQNLTLKTALMLQWSVRRCSPQMLYKTDDDVLINPWMMKHMVEENISRDLVGSIMSCDAKRDPFHKWYLPYWLFPLQHVSSYLSGSGYLINGKHIKNILTTAYTVPMINIEDIYFTFLVSKMSLNLTLTHDRRISPRKPWLDLSCMYWPFASLHSFKPEEMLSKWKNIQYISNKYKNNKNACNYFLFEFVWIEKFLY